jgi:hypothetical protein
MRFLKRASKAKLNTAKKSMDRIDHAENSGTAGVGEDEGDTVESGVGVADGDGVAVDPGVGVDVGDVVGDGVGVGEAKSVKEN